VGSTARASTWTTARRRRWRNWATGFETPRSSLHALHAPCIRTKSGAAPARTRWSHHRAGEGAAPGDVDEIKRASDIAEVIPFRYLIQHIGVAARSSTSASSTRLSRAPKLNLFARQRGVEILLENTPNELASARGFCNFRN